jgi:ferredoxin
VALAASIPFFLFTLLPTVWQQVILANAVLLLLVGVAWLILPSGRRDNGNDVPLARVDERDIMFARARLVPGTPNYEAYYAVYPEKQAGDDRTSDLPGLLSPQSSAYHPFPFASTEASFGLTEALREAVDGPVSPERVEYDPAAMTAFVKATAGYYGALNVGVAQLMPYHVYSHIGRGTGEYGAPIELDHRYAIAFTVEMDREMVSTAPYAATVMESALQYAESATVAIQLATLLRTLGYPTRAHIDGNYRVIAPLVARDAGLGEIGRMGLLMTPELGPRVRLGVVTTNAPLVPDGRGTDRSVLDFCSVCAKCANCCPIHAIPQGDRQEIDGAMRWRTNDEMCYRYWNAVGTDCARCMYVCPYSHPTSLVHNVVRRLVRYSPRVRPAVVWLDDLFYGAAPPPKSLPEWLPPKSPEED